MDCQNCKEHRTADPVPYIVHESAMARNERTIRRLVIALIISLIMMFACNAAWLYVWQLYDYSSEQTVVEAEDGVANYIGNDGKIYFADPIDGDE